MYEKYLDNCTNLKVNGYNYILKNKNVKLVEDVERIPMRGLFLTEQNNKLEILAGVVTTERIIKEIIYPILNKVDYRNSQCVNNILEEIKNTKRKSKYRANITKLFREIYKEYGNSSVDNKINFIRNRNKRELVLNLLFYAQGTLGEKKVIAYINKNNRSSNRVK